MNTPLLVSPPIAWAFLSGLPSKLTLEPDWNTYVKKALDLTNGIVLLLLHTLEVSEADLVYFS